MYKIYTHFREDDKTHHYDLIHGITTIFVAVMFILFMMKGLDKPSSYHLQCGLISIIIITVYIGWWYSFNYFSTDSHPMDPITEGVLYTQGAAILIYNVVYFRFIAPCCPKHKKKKKKKKAHHSSKRSHSRSKSTKDHSHSRPLSPRTSQSHSSSHSSSSSRSKSKSKSKSKKTKEQKYRALRSSNLYEKCVPILLLDNEICTIYFASCIYDYYYEIKGYSHGIYASHTPFLLCISCLVIQWLLLCFGYRTVKFFLLC